MDDDPPLLIHISQKRKAPCAVASVGGLFSLMGDSAVRG